MTATHTEGPSAHPASYPPPERFAEQANACEELYGEAEQDRLAFWAKQANRLSWATPFTEVDDFLSGRFYPELATNQSHVADGELTKMLIAQRREMDPKKRKQIVDDIQRYLADKAYYVYVPQWPQYVAHPPYVKGFRHHDGYGLGMRLLYTWLDK